MVVVLCNLILSCVLTRLPMLWIKEGINLEVTSWVRLRAEGCGEGEGHGEDIGWD